jgi:predicted MFS family arabinose efflux permease
MPAGDGSGDAGPINTVRSALAPLRGGGRGWLLLCIAGGWLLVNGFRVLLPVLLPRIKADFAIGNAEAGFALTVLWGLYAALQFPGGLAADRVGERRLVTGGLLLAAASFAAFYVAHGYGLFLAATALFGFGAGFFGTPRDMLLSRLYPSADNTAYGITFAAGSLGSAALPFAAAAIATRFGWRVAIVWLLPFMVLAAAGLRRLVPEREDDGLDRLPARETVSKTVAALSERRVLYAGMVMLLFIFSYQGFVAFLPTYLVEVKGLSEGLTAALFGLMFVFGAVVNPVAGQLADRVSERATLFALIGLSTVTLAVLPFVGGRLALGVLVPLLGIRIAIGPLTSAFIVRELPTGVQGTGWGLLRTVFFGLGATSSSVIGLFADAGRFDAGFLLLAGVTGLIAVFWWRVPRQ